MTACISPRPRYTTTPADFISTKALSQEDQREACRAVIDARRALEANPTSPTLRRAHRKAVEYVVRHNQGIIFLQARRVHRRCKSLEIEDLMQWGNVGLLRALETFDLERNICFGTYAQWWIRSFIQRSLVSEDTDVRVPAHTVDARKSLNRKTTQFAMREGREPSREELAHEMGFVGPKARGGRGRPAREGVAKVDRLLEIDAVLSPASFDATVRRSKAMGGHDDEATLHDFAPSHDPSPEELALGREHEVLALGLLAELPDRERAVVIARFFDDKTLAETGHTVLPRRVTRERTRQIEQQALGRLREVVRKQAAPGDRVPADR